MSHWPKPEREEYETEEIYQEQLEMWREHEEQLMCDYFDETF